MSKEATTTKKKINQSTQTSVPARLSHNSGAPDPPQQHTSRKKNTSKIRVLPSRKDSPSHTRKREESTPGTHSGPQTKPPSAQTAKGSGGKSRSVISLLVTNRCIYVYIYIYNTERAKTTLQVPLYDNTPTRHSSNKRQCTKSISVQTAAKKAKRESAGVSVTHLSDEYTTQTQCGFPQRQPSVVHQPASPSERDRFRFNSVSRTRPVVSIFKRPALPKAALPALLHPSPSTTQANDASLVQPPRITRTLILEKKKIRKKS